jgi:hypothetical protein
VSSIIAKIYGNDDFRRICKSIAKKKHLAEDLHSMFIEELLKAGEEKLSKYEERELNVYCVGVIYNTWNKRTRHKIHCDGRTSDLFEYSSTLDILPHYSYGELPSPEDDINEDKEEDATTPLDHFVKPDGINYEYTNEIEAIKSEIAKNWDNPNMTKMYQARVFYSSYFDCKSPSEFSKKSKIAYHSIWHAIKEFKEHLRKSCFITQSH